MKNLILSFLAAVVCLFVFNVAMINDTIKVDGRPAIAAGVAGFVLMVIAATFFLYEDAEFTILLSGVAACVFFAYYYVLSALFVSMGDIMGHESVDALLWWSAGLFIVLTGLIFQIMVRLIQRAVSLKCIPILLVEFVCIFGGMACRTIVPNL
ncbi:MAG: hypothetical protein NT120_00485 [Candidatus Aenigmarchaeota archaeon]|nr:hypothetical protein [Candidatus Aenigmarchaeota archaeon]